MGSERQLRRPSLSADLLVFAGMVLFITAVSVHDAALVVLNEATIAEEEQNPIGRWLISRGGGNVWPFVLVKLFGTAVVGAVLVALYGSWRPAAMTAAAALACFQLGLLLYLSLA